MEAGHRRRRRLAHLPLRQRRRRSANGPGHEIRPAPGRAAHGGGTRRNRTGRFGAAKRSPAVRIIGRGGSCRLQTPTLARGTAGKTRIQSPVLGQRRLGPILHQVPDRDSGRLARTEIIQLGRQPGSGRPLPASRLPHRAVGNQGNHHRPADWFNLRGADAAVRSQRHSSGHSGSPHA